MKMTSLVFTLQKLREGISKNFVVLLLLSLANCLEHMSLPCFKTMRCAFRLPILQI